MKKFLLAATCALMALAMVPSVSQAAPPQANPDERAVATTQPSVVYLEQYWSVYVKVPHYGYINGGHAFKLSYRCSGFVVSPDGYIVTAGHCINVRDFIPDAASNAVDYLWNTKAGQAELYSLILRGEVAATDSQSDVVARATSNWAFQGQATGSGPDLSVFVQRGTVAGGKRDGEALPARVIGSEPLAQGDVSILKVEKSNLPAIQLGDASSLSVGTPVIAVGYPGNVDEVADQSLDPSFASGKINAKKTLEGGLLPTYQFDASTSGGMSGGPVVDESGKVVGLVSEHADASAGGAFKFMSPATLIKEMLSRTGTSNSLSSDDKAWRAGLDLYFKGDGKGALKQFQSIQDQSRPMLADYLTKAQAVAKTQGGFPMVILIVVVAALLIGGGIAAAMVTRKRKSPAQSPAPVMAAPEPNAIAPAEPAHPVVAESPQAAPPAQPAQSVISATSWQAPAAATEPAAPAAPAAPVAPATPAAPASQSAASPALEQEPAPSAVTTHVSPPNGASAGQRYCSKCGNAVAGGVNFCPNCGNKVA